LVTHELKRFSSDVFGNDQVMSVLPDLVNSMAAPWGAGLYPEHMQDVVHDFAHGFDECPHDCAPVFKLESEVPFQAPELAHSAAFSPLQLGPDTPHQWA
jgi:hypothetical protein